MITLKNDIVFILSFKREMEEKSSKENKKYKSVRNKLTDDIHRIKVKHIKRGSRSKSDTSSRTPPTHSSRTLLPSF